MKFFSHVNYIHRQISHDPSSPLPCHDLSDNDEHLYQSQDDEMASQRPSIQFKRMRSKDSVGSKSSQFSNTVLSSSPSDSAIIWSRPQFDRLSSRISDYSCAEYSLKEENEDECDDNENDSLDEDQNEVLYDFAANQVILIQFLINVFQNIFRIFCE